MLERARRDTEKAQQRAPGARLVSFVAMQYPRVIFRNTMRRVSDTGWR